MCRSAIEYPPNGKRCGFGDHFTEAEREARRLKRNAREKELYYIRKNNKATATIDQKPLETITETEAKDTKTEVAPSGNRFEKEHSSLRKISADNIRLGGGEENLGSVSISTEESRRIAATILSEVQDDLAYMKIVKEDEDFSVSSTNEVSRLFLEDGSVGYFKNYDQAAGADSETTNYFGHDVLESFNNEVVAYRLCQIMGGEYGGLVPKTVLREYNGKLGTLQTEAEGKVRRASRDAGLPRDYDKSHLRNVALFEYLAGSQDRHLRNYSIIDNGHKGEDKVVLIDNGCAFPHLGSGIPPYNNLELSEFAIGRHDDEIILEPQEIKVIEKVKTSLENGELNTLLSKNQKAYMKNRIEMLLKNKKLDSNNYNYNMRW